MSQELTALAVRLEQYASTLERNGTVSETLTLDLLDAAAYIRSTADQAEDILTGNG